MSEKRFYGVGLSEGDVEIFIDEVEDLSESDKAHLVYNLYKIILLLESHSVEELKETLNGVVENEDEN